jgi:hypothetical protein
MSSAKTFVIYALAVLSGLVLLGGLRGVFNPVPADVASDRATLAGYWGVILVALVLGSVGLTWSLKRIRRQKKPN